MSDIFPVVFGICVDAEAAWIGRDPKNAARPVLLSNGTKKLAFTPFSSRRSSSAGRPS